MNIILLVGGIVIFAKLDAQKWWPIIKEFGIKPERRERQH
jgi:hypothetical protein